MDELEQLQETIFSEIQRTEKAMHDMNLRALIGACQELMR
jgi:hypothetical protein